MTIDKAQLKALAEAFPSDLDWDHNTEPFFNGPSGESLGGGSTGFFSVYGQPFEIDGDPYDGTEYVGICTREFAEFVCVARSGVLALLAEIEELKATLDMESAELAWSDSDGREIQAERDKLRAELAGLRTGHDAQNAVIAELRRDAERYRFLRDKAEVSDLEYYGYQTPEGFDSEVDSAMAEDATHD